VGRAAVLAVLPAVVCCCFGRAETPAAGAVQKNTKFPQHILIIRHAEKTGDKADVHLAERGKERAAVLEQLFVASKDRPEPFPTPDFLFAATNHKDSQRPLETISPLAMKLKLSIIDRFDNKLPAAPDKAGAKEQPAKKPGMTELRDELFGNAKYHGKTILVAWRHSTLPELARTLKAGKVPEKWEDQVFDRVWHLSYDELGAVTFRDRPQRLLPGDAEK
jgi:hypothetical protein